MLAKTKQIWENSLNVKDPKGPRGPSGLPAGFYVDKGPKPLVNAVG